MLHSPTDTSNPFFQQLGQALPDGVVAMAFSWREALLGPYDVLHLHWPERLVRAGNGKPAAVRRLLTLLLLARLTVLRVAVVRTLHNATPHDGGSRVEEWLLRLIDRRTTLWVTMTEAGRALLPVGAASVTVPHGSYHGRYPFRHDEAPEPDRLLYVGRIRPYKGIVGVLDLYDDPAFAPPFHLRVAGRPTTPELADRLAPLGAGADPRTSGLLRFVEEDELVDELARARAVLLPYDDMGNSGALLLALSAGRPVLSPRTPVNEELQAEVGADWLVLYDPPLTADLLTDLWTRVTDPTRDGAPDLSARDWSVLGLAYAAAYDEAVRLGRGDRP